VFRTGKIDHEDALRERALDLRMSSQPRNG
jgi:hypothetical protein